MLKYFDNVKCVYGPYTDSNNGRLSVNVFTKDGRKRFVSYPKFLVEAVLGRELDPKLETIDHIDHNFTNNAWDNLRVIDMLVHTTDDAVRVKLVEVACAWCGSKTHRRPKEIATGKRRNQAGPFCTKKCTGRYAKAKQTGSLPKQEDHYMHWDQYAHHKTVYYTLDKGGETVVDLAWRLDIDLPTEDEILAATPRSQTVPRAPKPQRACDVCGELTKNQKYCSSVCTAKAARKVKRPSKEKLHRLVWKYPTTYIAERLGVSSVAVGKWCRQYGVDKPPRGYWTKQKAKRKNM